jgi:hypothetical protein
LLPDILTKGRTDQQSYVAREGEVAEGPCLCMFRAVFAEHGPNSNDSTSENSRDTSGGYHLPQRLAHAEQASCNRNSEQGKDENWFPPVAIRSLRE